MELCESLEANASRWGCGRVLQRWANKQPWRAWAPNGQVRAAALIWALDKIQGQAFPFPYVMEVPMAACSLLKPSAAFHKTVSIYAGVVRTT